MRKYIIQWMAVLFLVAGMFAGPGLGRAEAAEQAAVHAPIDLRNATYTIEAVMTGENGVGAIQTPTSVFVKDKKAILKRKTVNCKFFDWTEKPPFINKITVWPMALKNKNSTNQTTNRT